MSHASDGIAEFTRYDYLLADDMLREAAEAHHTTDDNLPDIRATFDALVGHAHRSGSFVVVTERLIADHLWQRASQRSGSNARQLLKDAALGESAMTSPEEWLDQVVTVGKHRRTTVRYLTRHDLPRMIQVRQDNYDRAKKALQLAQEGAAVLDAALSVSVDLASALTRGALRIAFECDDEEMSA